MMSYGDKEWAGWVLDKQEECDAHVRKAWEHGERAPLSAIPALFS